MRAHQAIAHSLLAEEASMYGYSITPTAQRKEKVTQALTEGRPLVVAKKHLENVRIGNAHLRS